MAWRGGESSEGLEGATGSLCWDQRAQSKTGGNTSIKGLSYGLPQSLIY